MQASRDGQDRPLHSMLPVQSAGDSSDSSSKCSTVQLAWLDLLQDLTNFFSKELKLLLMMSKSAELAEFFSSHNKASSWKSGVKNMRNVLTEVRVLYFMLPTAGKVTKRESAHGNDDVQAQQHPQSLECTSTHATTKHCEAFEDNFTV